MRSFGIFTSLGLTVAVLAACAKAPDERCEPRATYDVKGAILYEPVIEGDCQPYFAPQVAADTGGGGSGGGTPENGGDQPGNGGPPDNGDGPSDNGGGPPDNGDGSGALGGSVRSGAPATTGGDVNADGGGGSSSGGSATSSLPGFSVRAGNT